MMNTKFAIEFVGPNKLNELKDGENVTKTVWTYTGVENGILMLDTNNWTISCEANNVCESISKWVIDEASCTMQIPISETPGFLQLDYPFAVSMIGQMCEAKDLLMYLQSLQEVFHVGRKQHDGSFNAHKKE